MKKNFPLPCLRLAIGGLCLALLSESSFARPPQPDAQTMAAIQECAEKNGLPAPGSGTRPTEAQQQAMNSCLQAKGIKAPPPPGPGGQRPPPPPQENQQNNSDTESSTAQ